MRTKDKQASYDKKRGCVVLAKYPKKATYRTFVIDAKTGEWKQIEIKDIPKEKIYELCDKFALGAGYERVK